MLIEGIKSLWPGIDLNNITSHRNMWYFNFWKLILFVYLAHLKYREDIKILLGTLTFCIEVSSRSVCSNLHAMEATCFYGQQAWGATHWSSHCSKPEKVCKVVEGSGNQKTFSAHGSPNWVAKRIVIGIGVIITSSLTLKSIRLGWEFQRNVYLFAIIS